MSGEFPSKAAKDAASMLADLLGVDNAHVGIGKDDAGDEVLVAYVVRRPFKQVYVPEQYLGFKVRRRNAGPFIVGGHCCG